jgi:hypothetical protein
MPYTALVQKTVIYNIKHKGASKHGAGIRNFFGNPPGNGYEM